ncbi:bifunctional DNA primase/polymerase [Nocardia colli]|uniref:bifunctional DNA primase/polymerase n=1 Tax=Nocardia colli TaxID=2545717 RepID=UPI0035DC95A4
MLAHALAYARANIQVIPLRGKIPLTEHGKDDATTDPHEIGAWWQLWPFANIGLRPPRGIVILDVDPRNGGTVESLGRIPLTRAARTGAGGWHLWLRYSHPVRGKVVDAPGVDVKTHTGYVVAPPSVHPVTGRRYQWLNQAPIQPLPHHLRERVRAPDEHPARMSEHALSRDSAGLAKRVSEAQPGERNNILFWACACAFEEGANPEVLAAIVDAARSIGLSDTEITRTVQSAERRR